MRGRRAGHGHGRRAAVALRSVAEPDADLEGSLTDWRRYRRRKRTAEVHWIDALYHAYLTAIIGLVAVAVLSSMVGDEALSAAQVASVQREGPGWLGVAAALAVAVGLRSGSRGGPLALERAEVRQVLLAPVDRTSALRSPALKQIRFLGFVGIVVGGIGGDLASRRLPGGTGAWVGTGALAGATLVGLSVGSALVASGWRLPRWAASVGGLGLVGLALADGTGAIGASPTEPFGRLVLWPLEGDLVGLAPVVLALALVVIGLALLGRASLEHAERRSTLVGQLRFAATLQDLRTVIVLRRQLAMELPRLRPWVRLRVAGTDRLPVFTRGLRGLLRWPAARLARLVLLGVVAGLCLRGVWAGTTPLVVGAGLALFVAGLDAVEALAQEVDHPSRRDSTPLDAGAVHLRHLPIGVVGQLLVAAVAAGVAAMPGGGQVPGAVAALGAIPLALGGLAGAVVSVLSGPASTSGSWALAPPEAQGLRLAVRTAWPPGLATLGVVPVLVARDAMEQGRPAVEAAGPFVGLALVLFAGVCGWVRVRDEIGEWFAQQMEQSSAR